MSEDIFGGLESGSEGEIGGTPIEFSGVSGGHASSRQESPASQPQKQTVVESVASTSAEPQVFQCPVCKRKLKTATGYSKHLANHNIRGLSSKTVGNQSTRTRDDTGATSSATVKGFICPDCEKTLKTEGGYLKHRASHKLKDANKRKPSLEKLNLCLKDIMDRICDEVIAEPIYSEAEGAVKRNFIEELKQKHESGEWSSFVSSLSDFIFSLLVEDCSKILPLNRYEEVHKKLQAHLCDEDIMISLCAKLKAVSEVELDNTQLRRLVFRISLKLLYEIQSWVAQEMLSARDQQSNFPPNPHQSDIEKKAFAVSLGEIFRGFFKKGVVSQNREWQGRSACLCDTFIDGQYPISTDQFLNKENWFSGDITCIVPSTHAVNFFLSVESAMEAVSARENQVTEPEVIENIMGDSEALNIWFHLTSSHFSEECSLLFMKELVHVFIKRSLLLEERRRNRMEERSVRASQASLRTHLKRNYTSKEDDADLI